MAKEEPFSEDMMTLIMGLEPSAPGQHGRTLAPMPDKDAIGLISEIKDMCEEFLMRADKGDDDGKADSKQSDMDDNKETEEE